MPAKSKSCVSFTILVLSAFVLTNCGGGSSGGGGNDNGVVISLSTVTALYPNSGSNWNDYVKNDGSDYYTASDIACDGTETGGYTACLHGGEMRAVTVTGKASCSGLFATDSLDAFNWLCSAGTGTVQFVSTGLKDGKYLSDLLDFTTPAWKPNSVTVYDNGTAYGRTDSTTWWTNPVVVNNMGGALAASGTIYTVTSNMTGSYTFDASKIALVSKPGVTITGPGAGTDSYVIRADGSSIARDFLWFEGDVNAPGDDVAVYLNTVRFSSLRGVKAENATSGTLRAGIYLGSCANNALTSVSAVLNSRGVYLDSSSDNSLTSVTAANNAHGVALLASSNNNVLASVTAANNTLGLYLNSSSNNSLTSVTAANNTQNGVELLWYSTNNVLASITTANNGQNGVDFSSYSDNNKLTSVSATNNGQNGVYLYLSSNNALASVTAAHNTFGIYLNASSNNTLASITAASNSGNSGVQLYSSSNNNALSSVTAVNNMYGVWLDSSSNNVLSSVSTANNTYGVFLNSSSNNKFTGLLQVGNAAINCVVAGGTNPGLDDATCAITGASDATLVTGITLTSSFIGKVTTNDTVNTGDANGAAAYDNLVDWTGFQNPFRGWGKDGSALLYADSLGQCTTGNTCRIWDWSLASGDTVIKDVLSLPTGTSTLTHTWSGLTTSIFLRDAVELTGNGNGLCESGETCLYTPNIGSYQGHGNLVSAGTITTGGTITNVTLMKYEAN